MTDTAKLRELLDEIEALIAGNDKFREIRLSADIARQALGEAK